VYKKTQHRIIKECLEGSERAFKTLYEEYQGYVYTICVRYGVSDIEVKDQMQVIFMEIFKSLVKYDSQKSQFKTWLTRITINRILMQKRKKQIKYVDMEDEKFNLIESGYTLSIEDKIDQEYFYKILRKMPEKYIAVFNLFIIDGYTHQEIAKELNISEGTSRVLLHRGRVWAMKNLKIHFKETVSKYRKAH